MVNLPYLIFGIDPGNTVGIAALDFSGRIVKTAGLLHGGLSETVSEIERIGTPSLIACDVAPLPDFVQKVAASFNAKVWLPPRQIREEEKKQIAKAHGLSPSLAHERDALAAAICAYRDFQNRLRQIDLLADFSKGERELLSHMVLNGFTLKRAIISLSQKAEGRPVQKAMPQTLMPSRPEPQLQKSLLEISRLSHENANLKKALDAADAKISSMQQKISMLERGVSERLRKDSQLRALRYEVQRLKGEIAKLAQAKKSDSQHAPKGGLNNLGEQEIDIGTLVEEYRKGKK